MKNHLRTDCRFWRGEFPCEKRRVCDDCDLFEPIGRRALVLKFGAPGDALRTTPLLARLEREGFTEITWICDAASREVLSRAPRIRRLLVAGDGALATLLTEEFDIALSLEKAPEALSLAMIARAADKRGFALTPRGRLTIFDERSTYALRLGVDDELKFRGNTKSVPRILFEMSGYEYAGEPYEYELREVPDRAPMRVALNLGVGPRWPVKSWPEENWRSLARILRDRGLEPVFVGGPAEAEAIERLARASGAEAREPSPLEPFAEFLASCGAVVTADSLALHLALAVRTPTVGLFCSTASAEIEWFGLGEALVAEPGPCYNPRCGNWPDCMASIRPDTVAEAVMRRNSS